MLSRLHKLYRYTCVLDCSASPTSLALPLNPIRKLIGKPWVLGSGLQPRWLMGLPDPEPLIDDSRVLRWAEPHSVLLVSLIFYRAWISDQFSGNAMREQVKKTEVLSVIKKSPRERDKSKSWTWPYNIDSMYCYVQRLLFLFWSVPFCNLRALGTSYKHEVWHFITSLLAWANIATWQMKCF